MNRRRILKFGLAGAATLGVVGLGGQLLGLERPLHEGRLEPRGRRLMGAVAGAVLDGSLDDGPGVRARQLADHLDRVAVTIAGFAPHAQAELAQLLLLIDLPPGRLAFAGLRTPWHEASVEQVAAALEHLRRSRWSVQQQAYHALRDVTNAAFYGEPGTWARLGYPGPLPI